MQLTVTMEKVGTDQVRAKVLAGAPFAVDIPVTVVDGTLAGGATTLGVAQGSVDGGPVTVTRTAGTAAAVTVDVDLSTQPTLPSDHAGYEFARASSGLPATILSACTLNPGDLWCGVVTVGAYGPVGYGFGDASTDTGALSDKGFSVGTNNYTIDEVWVRSRPNVGDLFFSLTSALTAADQAKLVLHVDDNSGSFAFSTATGPTSPQTYIWESSGLDWSSTSSVTLRLRDTSAPTNNAPAFTSSETFNPAENQTAVGTVAASDSDTGDDITGYALTGGADQALFSIGSTSGVLTFQAAPNYEDAQDANTDNAYLVEVQATSGTGDREQTATQTMALLHEYPVRVTRTWPALLGTHRQKPTLRRMISKVHPRYKTKPDRDLRTGAGPTTAALDIDAAM